MIKLKGLSQDQCLEAFPLFPVLVGYRGSIAHGMYVPNSNPNSIDDKDIMGVTIATSDYYFGLKQFEHKETMIDPWDIVVYELRKFVRLLIKANPNVLSLLWLKPEHYVFKNGIGDRLIENRSLFVSKNIYRAFTGYAYGQLKRMEHFKFEGYMGTKRKALVEKHGYDTKNAAHLIRLLRMGIEFLNDGVLYVFRHDGQQLLQIKNGEWTLEKVKREAEYLFKRAEEAYDRSTLPKEPNKREINEFLVGLIKDGMPF